MEHDNKMKVKLEIPEKEISFEFNNLTVDEFMVKRNPERIR